MTIKSLVLRQYRDRIDKAAAQTSGLSVPPEGWLRTVREALGMSGANVGSRLGVTRSRVSQAEAGERSGTVSLKTMAAMAEAMGCRFVYAIVPAQRIEDAVMAQARRKAGRLVTRASGHMALEDQALSPAKIDAEVERIARGMAEKPPADFWEGE